MKTFRPHYYDSFKCTASLCRHNCCIGWEIDIDEDTLEKYRNVPGDLGRRLARNISEKGTPHFILSENERCPFLNEKNLCDIISQLGEEYLCQICSDHPRFVNIFSDRTEIGLGMSCEEAARIILTQNHPFSLVCDEDDTEDTAEDEKTLFLLRDTVISIITDRTKSLYERIKSVLEKMNISLTDLYDHKWAEELSQFEILDEKWEDCLKDLEAFDGNDEHFPEKYETVFENLIMYFLYRHLAGALDDGCVNERIAFSVISTQIIYRICAERASRTGNFCTEDIIQIARMYSSEIEYSEENTQTFLDILFEII